MKNDNKYINGDACIDALGLTFVLKYKDTLSFVCGSDI